MVRAPKSVDKRISVILLEDNKHLGERFEVIKVKPIFARNILFPQGQAVLADANHLYAYKKKMEKAYAKKEKKTDEYHDLFNTMDEEGGIEFVMKANHKGVLYEKIGIDHIVNAIADKYQAQIPEHLFKMKRKLSIIGEHVVAFIYGDLERTLDVSIKLDAESQAQNQKFREKIKTQDESQEDETTPETTETSEETTDAQPSA